MINMINCISEFRLLLTPLFIIFSVVTLRSQQLLPGDLLFQLSNNSAFSQAITDSTAGGTDSINFVHVGIIFYEEDRPLVIEASPEHGVTTTPLQEFLNNSPQIDNSPGVVVKRLTIEFDANKAINNALSHIGEPYDWWYKPFNQRMYCSELVYESYRNNEGSPIFHSLPMNFRSSDGSMPQFWIDLFEQLGEPVPEGMQGTNPNDMARDTRLIEVKRFF